MYLLNALRKGKKKARSLREESRITRPVGDGNVSSAEVRRTIAVARILVDLEFNGGGSQGDCQNK